MELYETEIVKNETMLGCFQSKIIRVKEYNKLFCRRQRILFPEGNMNMNMNMNMTPQEELFKTLFNHEKILVCDMNTLELRAHREELAKIAFEARARLSAIDEEERGRSAKDRLEKGPKGFSRSLQTDDVTSDAINTIKKRQAKMSKEDKMRAGFEKLGIDAAGIEKLMSAGYLKDQQQIARPVNKDIGKEVKVAINPFAKKE